MTSETLRIVFIGGTGRCGTNILKKIFSKHSQVATLPFEHRFLIDPDGIIDFYSTFPQSWSPFLADKRLSRLKHLLDEVSEDKIIHRILRKILLFINKEGKFISPQRYVGWRLNKHFANFKKYNKRLIAQLHEFEFDAVYPGTDNYTFRPQLYHSSPKSKQELTKIFGDYLRSLIQDFLTVHKKEFFIEDNTWNIFFSREFLGLLPEAKIIHIYRDPRDVVASFSKQRWCPSDKMEAAQWYKTMMEYWFSLKVELPSSSYHETKLESLVNSPEKTIKELCQFTGLPFETGMLRVDLSRSHGGRWKKEFSENEKIEITDFLSSILNTLEYE
jgi:hypothetical protein